MLYLIKDFFYKIYLKIYNSKFIKWLFPIFIICFIPNVFAGTIMLDDGESYFAINSSTSLPRKFTWSGSSNGNVTIQLGTNTFGYPYLIIRICSNNNADGTTFSISNSSYGNNYFVDGSIPVYDSGESCKTGNNNTVDGSFKYLQLSVGKYEIQPSTGYNQYVASYLLYQNNKTWNQYITFYNAMLSDTDLISDQIQQQKSNQAILDSLSSLNSSITSQTNSINNNIDSESAAIQNKIDSAKNQAHSDHQDLMNQNHTYTNSAYDSPDGSSDINSTINKENQLRNNLNLDSSNVIVTLNTNATSYIWGIIDRIRAVDSRIVLLFTTVLSLGIIKMILNR